MGTSSMCGLGSSVYSNSCFFFHITLKLFLPTYTFDVNTG